MKNSEIKSEFKAKGLDEARKKLRYEQLSEQDKQTYNRYQENRRIEISVTETAIDIERKQIALKAIKEGANNIFISKITGLSIEFVEILRNDPTAE